MSHEDYDTCYEGVPSILLKTIKRKGEEPRSGREPTCKIYSNKKNEKMTLEEYLESLKSTLEASQREGNDIFKKMQDVIFWKKKLIKGVAKAVNAQIKIDGEIFPLDSNNKANLNVNFFLLDGIENQEKHNPYRDIDLDNLLKPVLDSLVPIKKITGLGESVGLVKNDSCFSAIKAQKIPVYNKSERGIEISCLTCKKFIIDRVITVCEEKLLEKFRPGWKSPMQYIYATDITDPKNKIPGRFIDNAPGCYFSTPTDKISPFGAPIPGYDWEKAKEEGKPVDGCIATKRVYNEGTSDEYGLFWLKKWQGNPRSLVDYLVD